MNLFLIGWQPRGGLDTAPAAAQLRELVAGLPAPRPEPLAPWRAPSGRIVVACAAHRPGLVGGVRYLHTDTERAALFSGRPFRWIGDTRAEGRTPLDPRFYLAPAADWMDSLDGRCVAARYDDREGLLEVFSDALGAYPLYWAQGQDARWISNNAQLVRRMTRNIELVPGALAGVLATGWALGFDSPWAEVKRFPRGAVVALAPSRPDRTTRQLPLREIAGMHGRGLDARRGAKVLIAATAALADWPGRPVVLQLSGGRDSRLLLAAARAGGIAMQVTSRGRHDQADVRIAAELCARAGVEHHVRPSNPSEDLIAGLTDACGYLAVTSSGAISLEHAGGYFEPPDGSLPLWLNGQGGEIARADYRSGNGLGVDSLVQALLARIATSRHLLGPGARQSLRETMGSAVAHALACGVAARDVPDAVYLEHRMAGWAAIGHGCVEYAKGDPICPLWSRRLLPDQLGAPAQERAAECFPNAILQILDPELAKIPYVGGAAPWQTPARITEVARRGREALATHPASAVIDPTAVSRLQAVEPSALDRHDVAQLWRLATVGLSAHPA